MPPSDRHDWLERTILGWFTTSPGDVPPDDWRDLAGAITSTSEFRAMREKAEALDEISERRWDLTHDPADDSWEVADPESWIGGCGSTPARALAAALECQRARQESTDD